MKVIAKMAPKYYSGIGSRRTPPDVMDLMKRIASRLELVYGYILRSGAADGADSAFSSGCTIKEVFLPWKNFNGSASTLFNISDEAMTLASELHPGWLKLSEGAKKLMSRNCYQILGENLNSPVDFVLCWTPDGAQTHAQRSFSTGGTGQAISLADKYSIPVFNLKNPKALQELKKLLLKSEVSTV